MRSLNFLFLLLFHWVPIDNKGSIVSLEYCFYKNNYKINRDHNLVALILVDIPTDRKG